MSRHDGDGEAVCPNCGRAGDGELGFCAACGADLPHRESSGGSLPKRRICSICGRSVSLEKESARKKLCEECAGARHRNVRKARRSETNKTSGRFTPSHKARMQERLFADGFYVTIRRRPRGVVRRIFYGRRKPAVAQAVDVSLTGMQCVAALALDEGDVVDIEMVLPPHNARLRLGADVRWAVAEADGRTRTGLRFDAEGRSLEVRRRLLPFLQALSLENFHGMDEDVGEPA